MEYIASMEAVIKPRMTVDEFLAWAVAQPKRYELHCGEVYMMSPESAGHAEMKAAVYTALMAGIKTAKVPCHALPDGMTVRIDDETAYEPDAIVYCGPKIARSAIEVPNPVVVVEVLSPSTRSVDLSIKLAAYFCLPSVVHYLIVDPNRTMIIHHRRGPGDDINTRIVTDGSITLDPPGVTFAVVDVYGP
jgi:Uma2 family endonuclease